VPSGPHYYSHQVKSSASHPLKHKIPVAAIYTILCMTRLLLITLINMLARTAKLQWGLGYKALETIYVGAVVPILMYGAPIWVEAIQKNKNLTKHKRMERLINIKIAKAYQTISYDSSCMIAGVRRIQMTTEQKVQTYMATKIWCTIGSKILVTWCWTSNSPWSGEWFYVYDWRVYRWQ